MDNLRKLFARQPLAKDKHYTPTYFSYNNKQGACPICGGTGIVTLDIQFLPDMQQIVRSVGVIAIIRKFKK